MESPRVALSMAVTSSAKRAHDESHALAGLPMRALHARPRAVGSHQQGSHTVTQVKTTLNYVFRSWTADRVTDNQQKGHLSQCPGMPELAAWHP